MEGKGKNTMIQMHSLRVNQNMQLHEDFFTCALSVASLPLLVCYRLPSGRYDLDIRIAGSMMTAIAGGKKLAVSIIEIGETSLRDRLLEQRQLSFANTEQDNRDIHIIPSGVKCLGRFHCLT